MRWAAMESFSLWSVSMDAQCAWCSWQVVLRVVSLQNGLILLLKKEKKEKGCRQPQSLHSPALEGLEYLSWAKGWGHLHSPGLKPGEDSPFPLYFGESAPPSGYHTPAQHTKKRPLVVEIHILYKYLFNTYTAKAPKNRTDIVPTYMELKDQ